MKRLNKRLMKRGPWLHVRAGFNAIGVRIEKHPTKCKDTLEGREAAEKYLRDVVDVAKEWPLKEAEETVATKKPRITFDYALAEYLLAIQGKTKEVTREIYSYDLKKYLFGFLAVEHTITVGKTAIVVPAVSALNEITELHCTAMQSEWSKTMKPKTVVAHRRVCNSFFNFCVKPARAWMPLNPWEEVATSEPDDDSTLPLDEGAEHTNWERIRTSIAPWLRTRKQTRKQASDSLRRGPWRRNPETFLALLELMYETGLRRSDAVKFDPRKIEASEIIGYSYTTKQHKAKAKQKKTTASVTVFLKPWLAAKLKALPVFEQTSLPFYSGSGSTYKNYLDHYVTALLKEFGDQHGIPGLRPHRFRDSFAVNFLNAGGSLDDLKILLGHSSVAVTERHYAPWCKSRQTALEARVARNLNPEPPAPKLALVPAPVTPAA